MAVRDLSRAMGVCERTLRNAFHAVYGVGPKQYLLRHGLDEAHDALQHARADRATVTQIATACGFFELGRFAAAYRRRFGERPSDTLRAAQAAA